MLVNRLRFVLALFSMILSLLSCILFLPTLILAEEADQPFEVRLQFSLSDPFKVSHDKFEVFRGMPVCLTVCLMNRKAIWEVEDLLSKRIVEKVRGNQPYDIEKERISITNEMISANKIPVTKIDNENFRWHEAVKVFVNGQNLTNYLCEDAATSPTILAANRVEGEWYIAPENTLTMTPGEYKIVALFDTEALTLKHPDIWHGKVVSNQIDIVLKEAETDEQKAWKYYALAEYYRRQEDFEKGTEAAINGLQYNPNSVDLHAVCGLLYEQKGYLETALYELETALKLFYEQNPEPKEHPLGLIEDIRRLKKTLESKPK